MLGQLPVCLLTVAPVVLQVVVVEVSEGGAPRLSGAVHLGAGGVLGVIVDEGELTILVERSFPLMIGTSDTQPTMFRIEMCMTIKISNLFELR